MPDLPPGPDCVVTVGSTRLVILDDACANRLWQVRVDGREHVLLWEGGLLVADDQVVLERWTDATEVLSLPCWVARRPTPSGRSPGRCSPITSELRRPRCGRSPRPRERHRRGGGGSQQRLSAPIDDDFTMAAVIEIDVPIPDDEPNAVLQSSGTTWLAPMSVTGW